MITVSVMKGLTIMNLIITLETVFNPICSCSLSVENNVHFFLHCHNFSLQRQTLMNNIKGTVMQTEKAPMDDRLRDRYPSCPYL